MQGSRSTRETSRQIRVFLTALKVNFSFFSEYQANRIKVISYMESNGPTMVVYQSLVESGAIVDSQDTSWYGFTSLHWAASNGNREIAQFLISKGNKRLLGAPEHLTYMRRSKFTHRK